MTDHARLSASGADIWMNCTAAPAASKGMERKATVYTSEGSAAHMVAENHLNDAVPDLDNYVGATLQIEGFAIDVDQDMVDAVRTYTDFCTKIIELADWHELEVRVTLDPLWTNEGEEPPEPMFGTADFLAYLAEHEMLILADYKHGKGVPVEVEDNPQFMYYALAALLDVLKQGHKVDVVRIVCVQPRAPHKNGPIRLVDVPAIDLLIWGDLVKDTVEDIQNGDTKFKVGKWCRWCPALKTCKAVAKDNMAKAQVEFDDDGLATTPSPGTLTMEELELVLDIAETVSSHVQACRAEMIHRIEQGEESEHWKLADKRAMRKWTNDMAVRKRLKSRGIDTGFLDKDPALVSPAQAEKRLSGVTTLSISDLSDLISRVSSGTTLVRASDDRPSVKTGAAADFDVISHPVTNDER